LFGKIYKTYTFDDQFKFEQVWTHFDAEILKSAMIIYRVTVVVTLDEKKIADK